VSLHLALILAYSLSIVAIGIWTSRYVRSSKAFFVAGRSLGPGLVFASMLAANIGAGSTVGATGLAYREGLSAWWWVGSAGIGSLVFAFAVAPKLWRLAAEHDFYTTGDYIEYRYGPRARGLTTIFVGLGVLALLAGQLIAGATIVSVITGAPRWVGALIGGSIVTIYFTAGGLLGSAWINALQLVVMLAGFLVALPALLQQSGGIESLAGAGTPPWFGDVMYSSGPGSGWTLLFLLAPAFIVSPGLIQKAYGAASARAVTWGVALNGLALLAFAFIPVLFGMTARQIAPGLDDSNAVLPMLLARELPPWVGAIALAAVFSTAVDTCDAILFMLASSASQDVYRRFIKPAATDAEFLRVGRVTAIAGGVAGIALSITLQTVIDALTIFYSLLVVTLFVPIIAGLAGRKGGEPEALAAMLSGVLALFVLRSGVLATLLPIDPTLGGIATAAVAYCVTMMVRPGEIDERQPHPRH
jgi:solute:Na+ symporter, SSS family